MTNFRRGSFGIGVVVAALAIPWAPGLGACSSSDSGGGPGGSPGFPHDGSAANVETSTVPFDGALPPAEDAPGVVFGDDANGNQVDGSPASGCPGAAPPAATTGACAIDTSESCPSCASWGFVCNSFASPQMQGVTAASFCRATATDAGALVCCTHPACIVTTSSGGCDASAQTRYDCSGGAVPTGTCSWLGAGAPNDYCCE